MWWQGRMGNGARLRRAIFQHEGNMEETFEILLPLRQHRRRARTQQPKDMLLYKGGMVGRLRQESLVDRGDSGAPTWGGRGRDT